MNNQSMAITNFRNPATVRRIGIEVLTKELGAVGMAYFMRQFETGYGDYTAERDELLAGFTNEDIITQAMEIDRQRAANK